MDNMFERSEIGLSANKTSQISMPGETAAIRLSNPHDSIELGRLEIIDTDPKRVKWFESNPDDFIPLSDEELREKAKNSKDHMLFVVSGSVENYHLPRHEKGRLQGWIHIEPDDPRRIQEMLDKGLLETHAHEPHVLEVTYSRLPRARSHQMASGLRQVLLYLAHRNLDLHNVPFHDTPQFTVVAYIIDDERGTNKRSVRVLQNAGFVESGRVRYDDKASEEDRLFVLDWNNLNTIVAERRERAVEEMFE